MELYCTAQFVEQKRSALVSRRLIWMTPLQLSHLVGKCMRYRARCSGVQNILSCWLVQPGPRKPILHHAQVMLVSLCLRSCRLPCLPVASALARARSGDAGSRCWWSLLGIDLFEGYRVAGSVGYSGYGLAVVPSIADVTEPSGANDGKARGVFFDGEPKGGKRSDEAIWRSLNHRLD